MKRIALGVSGSCTIANYCLEQGFRPPIIFADRGSARGCRGEEIAAKHGVPYLMIPRKFGSGFDREAYTRIFAEHLLKNNIDMLAMMGLMTYFHPIIFEIFGIGKVVNIHPSLFENGAALFPGDKAVENAFDAGVEVSGTTIHYATDEMDKGPVIATRRVRRLPEHTTVKLFHEAIKEKERPLYYEVLTQQMRSA